ncbi:MAG: RHS repeat-associated core domain-containing protein [Calditrichaeota bacterium]|nr:MAG: RHS repeat-associated core domain-containing protein [Calditrichota bacterium]
MKRRYVPGPGTNEVVAWYEGAGVSERRFFYQDERGSVVAVANDAGAAIATFRYGPWGESTDAAPGSGAGTGFSRFGYTGAIKLPGTDLLHMRARVYATELARFLEPDPIGFASGQLNLYSYVGNDPVNFTDPSGLRVKCMISECYPPPPYPMQEELDCSSEKAAMTDGCIVVTGTRSSPSLRPGKQSFMLSQNDINDLLSPTLLDIELAGQLQRFIAAIKKLQKKLCDLQKKSAAAALVARAASRIGDVGANISNVGIALSIAGHVLLGTGAVTGFVPAALVGAAVLGIGNEFLIVGGSIALVGSATSAALGNFRTGTQIILDAAGGKLIKALKLSGIAEMLAQEGSQIATDKILDSIGVKDCSM